MFEITEAHKQMIKGGAIVAVMSVGFTLYHSTKKYYKGFSDGLACRVKVDENMNKGIFNKRK